MHHTTPPTEAQLQKINAAKTAAAAYAQTISALLPDEMPQKKTILHKLRTIEQIINEVISHT